MPTIPGKVLEELRSNLAHLRLRDPERRKLVARTAFLFHRSEKTVYRQLAQLPGPKRCTRKNQGHRPHRWRCVLCVLRTSQELHAQRPTWPCSTVAATRPPKERRDPFEFLFSPLVLAFVTKITKKRAAMHSKVAKKCRFLRTREINYDMENGCRDARISHIPPDLVVERARRSLKAS